MYDLYSGILAKKYAVLRMRDLPHFEKNAEGIRALYVTVEQHAKQQTKLSTRERTAFCHTLAGLTFGHEVDDHMLLPDIRFEFLCYRFSVYISYHEGLSLGLHGKETIKRLSEVLELPVSDLIWFSKKITEDLFVMYEDTFNCAKTHVA